MVRFTIVVLISQWIIPSIPSIGAASSLLQDPGASTEAEEMERDCGLIAQGGPRTTSAGQQGLEGKERHKVHRRQGTQICDRKKMMAAQSDGRRITRDCLWMTPLNGKVQSTELCHGEGSCECLTALIIPYNCCPWLTEYQRRSNSIFLFCRHLGY